MTKLCFFAILLVEMIDTIRDNQASISFEKLVIFFQSVGGLIVLI